MKNYWTRNQGHVLSRICQKAKEISKPAKMKVNVCSKPNEKTADCQYKNDIRFYRRHTFLPTTEKLQDFMTSLTLEHIRIEL